MESGTVEILISKFSEDLVDYILTDRGYPTIRRNIYSKNSPTTPFEECVGIVVIALIKGELKSDLETMFPLITNSRTGGGIHTFLQNYRELFLQNNPCNAMSVLKIIAVTFMCPFYYYKQKRRRASFYALQELEDMLRCLEGGEFVRKGGLSELSDFARNFIKCNQEVLTIYEQEDYPY